MKKFISLLMAFIISAAYCSVLSYADVWKKTDNGYVYTYDDGTTAEKGWLNVGKKTYYIQKDGTRKTGWLTLANGTKYYFDKKGVLARDRIVNFKSGAAYYFKPNGKMAVNFSYKDGKTLYYFGADGKLSEKVKIKSGLKLEDLMKAADNTFYGVGYGSDGHVFGSPEDEEYYLYVSPGKASGKWFYNVYFFHDNTLSGYGYFFNDDEVDIGKVNSYFTKKYDASPNHINKDTGECYWKFKSYYLSVFYFYDGYYGAVYSKDKLLQN